MEPDTKLVCRGCSYLMTAIIAILLIISYTVYVIARASSGAKFTTGDIICSAILISFGTIILLVMLVCLCLETKFCGNKERVIHMASRRFKRIGKTEGDCSICLDEKNSAVKTVVVLSCKHTFHKKCVEPWLNKKSHPNCPECRQPSKKFSALTKISELIRPLALKDKPHKSDALSYV